MTTTLPKYQVGNNTDYNGHSFETDDRHRAEREWRRIQPRPGAGNRYAAWFRARCESCGVGYRDAAVKYATPCSNCGLEG